MNDRHATIIEINVDDQAALQRIKSVQQALDRLQATADRLNFGGGGGGFGPGPGPAPSPSPLPPTDPNNPANPNNQNVNRGRAGGGGGSFMQGVQQSAMLAAGGSAGAPFRALSAALGPVGGPSPFVSRMGQMIRGSGGGDGDGGGFFEELGDLGGSLGRKLGKGVDGIIGLIGDAAKIALDVTAEATNQQFQRTMQFAGVEKTRAMGGLTGGMAPLGAGAAFGMTPEQAAAIQQQFGQIAGFRGANIGTTALELANAGVSMGAAGALARTLGPGGGGIGSTGVVRRVAGSAFSQGLRGSRVDEYLQTIASGINQMSQQGMNVSVDNVASFAASVGAGIRGALAASRLMSPIQRGRQQLLAPFQGMMSAAVQARAFQRAGEFGGGITGALQAFEAMGEEGPISTVDAARDFMGDDAAALAVAGEGGLSLSEARRGVRAVRTGRFRPVGGALPQGVTADTAPATMKIAKHQADLMQATKDNLKANLDVVDIVFKIEGLMQELAGGASLLLEKIKDL